MVRFGVDARLLLWAAVLLGLGLRAHYYLRHFAVWHDEAALIVNVLDRTFAEQLGPLELHEAAPPGFLWLERAVVLALGDSVWALRLVPFLASCAALLLFARLARLWLKPAAAVWAVLFFAVSDRLLWHACEAKPYSVDVLLAVLVLTLAEATRCWRPGRQLLLFALLSPLLIFTSFPGCFLVGGLLVAWLGLLGQGAGARAGYAGWVLVVGVSFLLLLLGPIRAQRCPEMDGCWTGLFPDWQRPWSVPGWAVNASAAVVHYACNPVGSYLAALALVAIVAWWRAGRRAELALLLVPVGLALVAAGLHAYPYGGARVLAYAAPAVLLLLGDGLVRVLEWLRARHVLLAAPLLLFACLPVANTAHRLVVPWTRSGADRAAELVLREFRPGDQIVTFNWEYRYYFRRPPARRELVLGRTPDPSRRLWVLATILAEAERAQVTAQAAAGRLVLARHEFPITTVLLLAPFSGEPSLRGDRVTAHGRLEDSAPR